jgi:hypothetical protein
VGRWYVSRGIFTCVRFDWLTFAPGGVALWGVGEGFFAAFAGLRTADALDFAVDFFFLPANAVDAGQARPHATITITHTRAAGLTCAMYR